MRTVYTDLGLDLDPVAMAQSIRWLHDYTAELVRHRAAVVRRRAGVCWKRLPPKGLRWRWLPTPSARSPTGR